MFERSRSTKSLSSRVLLQSSPICDMANVQFVRFEFGEQIYKGCVGILMILLAALKIWFSPVCRTLHTLHGSVVVEH